jgi:DNA gyrase subunit A
LAKDEKLVGLERVQEPSEVEDDELDGEEAAGEEIAGEALGDMTDESPVDQE